METNLLVGDRLFVTKFSYGYSKHSFPFSPPIFKGRILNKNPKRGDVIVFKTPADNRTDYIKRLIGLPGDTIQFIDGDLYINSNQVLKTIKSKNDKLYCGSSQIDVNIFEEKLPNGKSYLAAYRTDVTFSNSDKYKSAPSVATVIIASSFPKFMYFANFIEANIFAILENPNSGNLLTKDSSNPIFLIKYSFPMFVLKTKFKLSVALSEISTTKSVFITL